MTAIALGSRQSPSTPRPGSMAPLRLPLLHKLAIADILALGLLFSAASWMQGTSLRLAVLVLALAAVQLALLALALRPVRVLEAAAARILSGDSVARVQPSLLADSRARQLGDTLNGLLDALEADRRHFRELAVAAIETGDRERVLLGRELQDSTAQQLAALAFQLGAAIRDTHDDAARRRLEALRDEAVSILDGVQQIASATHSGVLESLGLVPALQQLVRSSTRMLGPRVSLVTGPLYVALQPATQAVLHRVALEAVRNAQAHARAQHVTVSLSVDDSEAVLTIVDDGTGFDVTDAERRRPALGLFMMHERVALLHGRLDITSAAGAGTRVLARVPLTTPVLPPFLALHP
ncbi:MAG: histidine kinase dimerization and phosphoacceptor region [Gemmatimonadetes bacterium]|nr:histidine kinase dimerization and phosphoacceptor region [Gemmatimonadota bacterium]